MKKATCLEAKNQIWQRLDELPIKPGVALYYQGKRIRKTQPVSGFFLAAKWKKNYRNQTTKEPWYILTNLGRLTGAIQAYKRRMGIEEMGKKNPSGPDSPPDNRLSPHRVKASLAGRTSRSAGSRSLLKTTAIGVKNGA
ncbi:MAG: hypothetical protein DI617_09430, partial [Streptococcus pyogenes]